MAIDSVSIPNTVQRSAWQVKDIVSSAQMYACLKKR